ncbi:hypothetical protein HDU80_008933 [Chytriomyces hyalinus]|nr:hypothetical protein HDU80_008933 [Chytriomyces hyalinus]
MQPVFKKGYREPLTMNDLWDIPESLDAETLSDKFEKAWLAELALYKTTVKPDTKRIIDGAIMRSALWKLWKAEVFPLSFMFIFSQLCSVFSPFMQQFIIEFVQLRNTSLEQSLATGIGYAMGLFALQILGTLVSNHFQQTMMMKSMAVGTMVKTAIYRKSLKLAPQARQKFGSGQIINLVTTDTMRIQMFMMQAVFVFVLPITLFITIGFLIAAIGWAAVIGISLLLFAVPLQTWLFKKMKVIRAKQAPITDARVKKTTEILNGVRVIKLFNWETSFFRMVQEIRKGELVQVLTRSVYQALVMTQAQTIPALCTCLSFVVYGLMNPLSASKVFSSMSWFNQLRMPLWMLPNILNSWAEFNVALTRVESLLLANELDEGFAKELPQDSKYAVIVEGGEFSWNGPVYSDNLEAPPPPSRDSGGKKKSEKSDAAENKKSPKRASPAIIAPPSSSPASSSLLKNINFKIEKERLTVIVGPVGSGKSSLLNALIGEMQIVQGSISTQDSMAYAAQTAWIQNATVKDNIVFGAKFDKARYLQVLYNAALLPDLRILKDKDQTSIGERGINLSGGQKQRINIARLMYNDASIVLLDDPLSAVDAHVGRHLFEKCILENMKGRTRVLVTHQLHFVPQCDYVIFMKDGLIVEQGSYSDLMQAGGGFAEMMKAHGGGGGGHSDNSAPSAQETEQQSLDLEDAFKELQELTAPREDSADIMTKEDQAVGGVSSQVWWRYILACGGVAFCIEAVLLVGLNEGTTVINNLWLTWWTSNAFRWLTNTQYALIYVGLALLSSVATFAYGYFFAFTGTRASKVMHEKALERILDCPVYFFDTTPVGRIINRFSADIDALDNSVASNLRQLASTASTTVATFAVMIIALPVFAAAVVPAMIVYWFVQDIYRRTARELKRLSSTARSPLYNNFGETLTGVATIRAYRDQERFIWRNDVATNVSNSPQYYLNTAGNWLSIRLQLLGSILVAFAAILGITSNALSATLFGLCLTYSLSITQTLASMVQSFTQCEISMNSAERVEHYAYRVETEKDDAKTREPPKNWPVSGTIAFSNVTMRYAPKLPVVLDAVSFDVRDREKIGIVGRTGSGKSSLMQALFRIVQTEGSICVDGIDISTLALRSVRTALAIIPQDPVVFSGSFRTNMDPFGEHSDADLWDALERAGLKRKVERQDEKLDANVDAGGENLSVGERQLLCLARAMLKKPKILIMDEATANVDMETDSVIQKSLREEFRDTTILTIAHRLNTIMDYDRVLVLDHGKVAEFDSPRALVADESTIFHSLVMGTGETNAEMCFTAPFDPNSYSNAHEVIVTDVHLSLTTDFVQKILLGSVRHTCRVETDGADKLVLDTKNLVIESATVDGVAATFSLGESHACYGAPLSVPLRAGLKAGDNVEVEIKYRTIEGGCLAAQWLEPSQTVGKQHPYLFTQCQPIYARTLAPLPDSPFIKLKYTAEIKCPSHLRALMSAVPVEETIAGNVKTCKFTQQISIPSYLIALAVGNIEGRRVGPRSTVWSEPEVVEAAAWEFADTELFVKTGEEILTPYVWGVYDLLVLPASFPYGGMENPCLTFVTPSLLAGDRSLVDVVAHEIAHSWMGNLVTSASWEHFWLNEGFTMFVERRIVSRLHGEPARHFSALLGVKALQESVDHYEQSGTPEYTRLVQDLKNVDPDDAFSSVPYEKGYHLLHYLEGILGGIDVFDGFLKNHVETFSHKSITSFQFKDNLYAYFEKTYGQEKVDILNTVDWDTWFYSHGMPPVKNEFDETLANACKTLANRWTEFARSNANEHTFSASDITSFSTNQTNVFLETLQTAAGIEKFSVQVLDAMDSVYNLTKVRNCEIRSRWQELNLACGREEIFPEVVDLITTMGRMKYVRPLYRALRKCSPAGEKLARETFSKHKGFYHPICTAMVEKDLA